MRVLLIGLVVLVGAVEFAPQLSGQAPPQDPAPVQAPAAPKVQLTFEEGGTVSLIANGASLREILAEWTRKGGTPFVGAERLSGAPMTLQYERRPETEVVGSLLRGAAGMFMAPRLDTSTGKSQLEVVYVLATSTATPSTSSYSPPVYNNPAPQPTVSSAGSPSVEIPPAAPGRTGEQPPATPAAPSPYPRPTGVSGVAVPVVAMPPAGQPTPTPTPTPPTTTGRGGGGGGGR